MKEEPNSVHIDKNQFYFLTPDGWGTLPVSMDQVNRVLIYIEDAGADRFKPDYLSWLMPNIQNNVVDKE